MNSLRGFVCGLESLDDLILLKRFIPPQQIEAMMMLATGTEEGRWYREKMASLVRLIRSIPLTYQSGGVEYTLYLRYFGPAGEAWIAERDVGDERYTRSGTPRGEGPQHQAYGLSRLDAGYWPEWGYISIPDLMQAGFELDLYFEPCPAREITRRDAA